MQSYIVNGGEKIEGELESSGSKNSSLPILAATILNKGKTVLKNVPDIHDTKIMFDIMRLLGCKINQEKNKIIIDSSSIDNYEILEDDSILEECPSINNYIYSVLRDRVLPESPLTTLKRAGVDEK